ncbi:M28 family peptidase [Ferruginibacter lapsinanis]|uniref:M28 family peptidase n=1 Tax=Ferruginibacter lapsinanis TaxID=563172 RepID=UPI001E31F7F2|nr:M28 family peptidase [Ferruginibacter lapsinanis]UEG50952.1 M28 family peptidase [Ferruginibacter lapsinanis]
MKKIFLSAIVLLLIAGHSIAQIDDAAKYAANITGDNLKKHLTIIASDEMEGRETGTEGQRKAAAYIQEQFKLLGLQQAPALKGYQQYYPLVNDSMISSSLKIGTKTFSYGTDYYSPVLFNATKKTVANKIVFAGYGIDEKNYNDYAGKDVKGKIVVLFLGEPKANGKYILSGNSNSSKYSYPGISHKLAIAKKKGAIGAIVIYPWIDTFNTALIEKTAKNATPAFPRESDVSINYNVLSHEAAKKLFSKWKMDSLIEKAKSYEPLNSKKTTDITAAYTFNYKKKRTEVMASNVLGFIEGSDKKDEYVFLTAHYDHLGKHDGKIYYGADDDGSGTCAVLQMATAFAKAKAEGHGPRRTIVFMTVSGEEKGLWGSEYYSDHPVFPLDKTSVDLNTDMVGRIDTERQLDDTMSYVYVIGHDKISSDLPIINEGVNNKYTNLTLDYKFDDPNDQERIYYRSDHYNFARKGVPILFFYDGMLLADYHQPTDTVEKITWPLYEKRVRMIFHTAWEIANRDEMLRRDKPLPPGER